MRAGSNISEGALQTGDTVSVFASFHFQRNDQTGCKNQEKPSKAEPENSLSSTQHLLFAPVASDEAAEAQSYVTSKRKKINEMK